MTEREMHSNDLDLIRRILGIPQKLAHVPQEVVNLYEKLQYAKYACSQPGALSDVELRLICLMADAIELPKPVECAFREVVVGTTMWFRVNKYEVVECQYAGVHDANKRLYKIRLWGDIHDNIREGDLFLEDPRAKAVEAPKAAHVDKSGEHEVAPPQTDDEKAAKEQRIDAAMKKLAERWPVGTKVDYCPPGEPAMFGVVAGYARNGDVKLQPENAPEGTFAWVSAADLYDADDDANEGPITTDEEEEDDDSDVVSTPETLDYREAFPKGSVVVVNEAAGDSFTGTVVGFGTGKFEGKIQVKPIDGRAAYKKWVPAESVASAEPVSANP